MKIKTVHLKKECIICQESAEVTVTEGSCLFRVVAMQHSAANYTEVKDCAGPCHQMLSPSNTVSLSDAQISSVMLNFHSNELLQLLRFASVGDAMSQDRGVDLNLMNSDFRQNPKRFVTWF